MKKLFVMAVPIVLLIFAGLVYLIVLLIRALRIYVKTHSAREKPQAAQSTLGTVIRAHRIECNMTQEFVAEALGVSRQAVSKWENGASDPSTANLIALARLFGISPDELLWKVF